MPTEEEITAALREHAEEWTPDIWAFSKTVGGVTLHETEKARKIVKVCLMLGQPVSDVITIDLFLAMAERLAAIEGRLDALVNA